MVVPKKKGLANKVQGATFKERLKVSLLPILAKVFFKLGWSWEKIGYTKIGRYTLLSQGNQIINNSKDSTIPQAPHPQKIVFLTMLGGHVYNAGIDICLALCLLQRGHEVIIVIDDQTLPLTQQIISGQEPRWKQISGNSYLFAKKYFEAFNLRITPVSSFLNDQPPNEIENEKEILEASLLRHFKVGILEPDLPGLETIKGLLQNSIRISSQVGQGVVQMNPDSVVMSHGIYSTWGPPFQILRQKNIPILTYGRGKKAGTSKFNWNCTADWWDVSEEWQHLRKRELTGLEENAIDEYLQSRISHKNDVFVYNFGDFEEREKTLRRFNLDPNKLTYSLFTNVLWDAASAQREIVFSNPIEWVIETIRWFRAHPNKQLIVKIHPAEQVIGTNMPFKEVLDNAIGQLPDNVRLIEPSEEVNSWSVYQVTDLGLVHTTTVGMELPLEGIPCAVVSKTHFRDRGFTIDVQNREEYFDLLANFQPENQDPEYLKKQSRKYAYLLFERYQMPLDLFNETTSTDVRSFRFNSIDELYQKPTIQKVVQAIENHETSILN